jgi:S-adenosylmethionine hydrolase
LVLITLTTDFRGHYLGIMRGVIKSRSPFAEIVDLSSDVEPFDVKGGSFVLYSSYRYFPHGTIHVAVVDPGVGSARKAMVIRTKNYTFVGPDNGILIPAAMEDGIVEVREITNKTLLLKRVSSTFHGRDVFAPVAAFLAGDGKLEEVGKKLGSFERLEFFKGFRDGAINCEVIFVDRFGNLTLSIKKEDVELNGNVEVKIGDRTHWARRVVTYADGAEGLVLLVGSAGFYELAVRNGSASELLRVLVGDRIAITKT